MRITSAAAFSHSHGQSRTFSGFGCMSALPPMSNVDLLGNGKSVIHLNAEVSNGAFDLAVPKSNCTARRLPVRR